MSEDASAPVDVVDGTIRADDGRELPATWFRPPLEAQGAVLIAPAMATRGRFYGPFATWLAARGFLALTFDYRGQTSRAELRSESGDLLRWAGDAASALEALIEEANGLPITWVGHSLGGQVLPFARHDLLDKVVLVACGLGYWRNTVRGLRWKSYLLWRFVAPATIAAVGYFPGRSLGVIGDVPGTVMRQWRRWCLDERYLGVDVRDAPARFAEISTPITALSMADDELLGDHSMRVMEDLFVGAEVRRIRLAPDDVGGGQVGHHGFFRMGREAAWDRWVLPELAVDPS